MAGGINAWQGLVAQGFPEAGIPWFAAARSAGELIALAWILEDSTGTFYARIAETAGDPEAAALFRELVIAEQRHREMLTGLYRTITGAVGEVDFPSVLGRYPKEKMMEGGMRLDDALAWAKDKGIKEILELAMSLETGSYDRYLALQEKMTDERSLEIFRFLADEEKRHLGNLTGLFEKHL